MVERAIGNCAIDAGTTASWREPLGRWTKRMYFSSDKDSFACTYTVSTPCRERKKKRKKEFARNARIDTRNVGVERDPIKLISTVPILICCPEIIPFHRVNSLVPFDSRYTR